MMPQTAGSTRRPQLRRRIAAAGALVLVTAAAATVLAPESNAATPPCTNVYFLGARGSGQPGPGMDGGFNEAAKAEALSKEPTDTTGLGPEVRLTYNALARELGSNWKMPTNPHSVSYPARGVDTMYPTPAIIAGLTNPVTREAALATYYQTRVDRYLDGIGAGATSAYNHIRTRAEQCPRERIVLAGFSQGAMVIHRMLWKLEDAGRVDIMNRIDGVGLIADGDRVPNSTIPMIGQRREADGRITQKAPVGAQGVGSWFGRTRGIPAAVRASAINVCTDGDIVCDFNVSTAISFTTSGRVHTSYAAYERGTAGDRNYTSNRFMTTIAKSFAARIKNTPAPLSVSRQVWTLGKPIASLQLRAALGNYVLPSAEVSPSTVAWRTAPNTSLPSGLALSKTGLISGTLARLGSGTIRVEVRKNTTPYSQWIPLAFSWGVVPAPTPTPTPAPASSVAGLAAGEEHSCAVTTSGAAECWGDNDRGQLGNGTTTDSTVPVAVTGLASGVIAITASGYHSCALTVDGSVKCWGDNDFGQLGNSTTTDSSVPVPVQGLESAGVTALSAGYYHACAVTSGGAAKCWGANNNGQLGNGTTTDSAVPVPVTGLGSGVTSLSGGFFHSCAVTSGAVKCWGGNNVGQLGDGSLDWSFVPVLVDGLESGVAALSAGYYHSCAVTSSGAAKCWGHNLTGQLGDGTTTDSAVPVLVSALESGVTAVAAGTYHSCALASGGAVKCWGGNPWGQLGDGNPPYHSFVPVTVSSLDAGVTALTTGSYHSCAVAGGGAAKCWGYNQNGQLGNGTTTDSAVPVQVSGLS